MSGVEAIFKSLRGVNANFRRGSQTPHSKEYIVLFAGVKSAKQSAWVIGRKVAWLVKRHGLRLKLCQFME